MKLLLDTNVVSEPTQRSPNDRVLAWIAAQDSSLLHISTLSLGEIEDGIERLPAGRRRAYLERWREMLSDSFGERLLPVDRAVALAWGKLRARTAAIGRTMPAIDALLAATAEVHGLTLVTRNVGDFEVWGGPVFNPWDER